MALISSGIPSSSPTWAVIADSVIMSMYSRIIGPTPLATMRGIACVTASSVGNGASTVAVCGARG